MSEIEVKSYRTNVCWEGRRRQVVRIIEQDGLWRARVELNLESVTIELEVELGVFHWAAASLLSELEIKAAKFDMVQARLDGLAVDVRRASRQGECPPEMIREIRQKVSEWFDTPMVKGL